MKRFNGEEMASEGFARSTKAGADRLEIFYEAPPGLIKEEVEGPEDCVPNEPGNEAVREFLKKAPTKGLW